ncbi:Trichothecene 3-O-acetyltransferase [Beauveria bassiana]|uniref:Trichothecene 3-O-acetyltransferase n=1 Tax=Beauveria bassiana TaxID=176275 RepID=A0A2N6NVJ1_BEABA|nr:Trichothecene 3-O-acetyltransferase [Beauveria bassiana]
MGSILKASKELVTPSTPLIPGYSPLTPLDQYMVRVILPVLCVFEIKDSSLSLKKTILNNLKQGLSRTIDDMPAIAAYVVTDSEVQESIRLKYDNDAGVWFHTKDVSHVDYDSLKRRSFPFTALPVEDFVPEPRGHSSKAPVLTAQAAFIQGGLVLTFNGHHAAMDAQGLGTFVQVWARHVAAVSQGRVVASEHRLGLDSLDGSSIYAPVMRRPWAEFPTFWQSNDRTYEAAQKEVMDAAMSGNFSKLATLLRLTNWIIDEDKLHQLRQQASPQSKSESAVTDNAALSALIWMHLSRARGLVKRHVGTSSLFTAINCRRRMNPPLAPNYPGNCIVLARATATSTELEASESQSLHGIAQLVADSLDWWAPDEIWSLTGAIQAHPNVRNALVPPMDYDVVVTSPSRLADSLSAATWGEELGGITAIRFAFPAWIDGFAVVLPSVQGGFEITLWTSPDTANRLLADEGWCRWVRQLE